MRLTSLFNGSKHRGNLLPQLVIYDDLFPYSISGFRLQEYSCLLDAFPDSHVYSTLKSLSGLGVKNEQDNILRDWRAQPGDRPSRLSVISKPSQLPQAHNYYTIFLNNAVDFLRAVERAKGMFTFTLYPGGGFAIGNQASDEKLRRVTKSRSFFKVIVTQPVTLDYVLSKKLVEPERVEYVWGGVLPTGSTPLPRRLSNEKLRLCFIANRYDPKGLDKGLDLFILSLRRLEEENVPFEAHFIGPWHPGDLGESNFNSTVLFHGSIPSHLLQKKLLDMDICIFPTRNNILGQGTFDGFPTGAAVEAGLAGCLVATTNPLRQQTPLIENQDFMLINDDVNSIVETVRMFHLDRKLLLRTCNRSMTSFAKLYSIDAQMFPRVQVISEMMRFGASRSD